MTTTTRKLKISEVFYSIEGEGPYTGRPTVFVRSFGCNFTCSGFSNQFSSSPAENIDGVSGDMPIVGCDSAYSWSPSSTHHTEDLTVDELLERILSVIPTKAWVNPESGMKPILCFTGGEPTLHQKFLTEFFTYLTVCSSPELNIATVLIETNCAVPLSTLFLDALNDWVEARWYHKLVWANSPKLSNSGESYIRAIRPEIYLSQGLKTYSRIRTQIHQYFKFVSDGSDTSFEEIGAALVAFRAVVDTLPRDLLSEDVFVMAEGASREQQEVNQVVVAKECLHRGYSFCARVHVWLYGNTKGT